MRQISLRPIITAAALSGVVLLVMLVQGCLTSDTATNGGTNTNSPDSVAGQLGLGAISPDASFQQSGLTSPQGQARVVFGTNPDGAATQAFQDTSTLGNVAVVWNVNGQNPANTASVIPGAQVGISVVYDGGRRAILTTRALTRGIDFFSYLIAGEAKVTIKIISADDPRSPAIGAEDSVTVNMAPGAITRANLNLTVGLAIPTPTPERTVAPTATPGGGGGGNTGRLQVDWAMYQDLINHIPASACACPALPSVAAAAVASTSTPCSSTVCVMITNIATGATQEIDGLPCTPTGTATFNNLPAGNYSVMVNTDPAAALGTSTATVGASLTTTQVNMDCPTCPPAPGSLTVNWQVFQNLSSHVPAVSCFPTGGPAPVLTIQAYNLADGTTYSTDVTCQVAGTVTFPSVVPGSYSVSVVSTPAGAVGSTSPVTVVPVVPSATLVEVDCATCPTATAPTSFLAATWDLLTSPTVPATGCAGASSFITITATNTDDSTVYTSPPLPCDVTGAYIFGAVTPGHYQVTADSNPAAASGSAPAFVDAANGGSAVINMLCPTCPSTGPADTRLGIFWVDFTAFTPASVRASGCAPGETGTKIKITNLDDSTVYTGTANPCQPAGFILFNGITPAPTNGYTAKVETEPNAAAEGISASPVVLPAGARKWSPVLPLCPTCPN